MINSFLKRAKLLEMRKQGRKVKYCLLWVWLFKRRDIYGQVPTADFESNLI